MAAHTSARSGMHNPSLQRGSAMAGRARASHLLPCLALLVLLLSPKPADTSAAIAPHQVIQASDSARACKGRSIHILNVPPKFNVHLMTSAFWSAWQNSGFGTPMQPCPDQECRALRDLSTHVRPTSPTLAAALFDISRPPNCAWSKHQTCSHFDVRRSFTKAEENAEASPIGDAAAGVLSASAPASTADGSSVHAVHLGPWPHTNHSWFDTVTYSLEHVFFGRLQTYECLSDDPSQADAVYIPYFLHLDIMRQQYLHGDNHLVAELAKWLTQQPSWARWQGSDHFFVCGQLGYSYKALLQQKGMETPVHVSLENRAGVPNAVSAVYPSYFHPHTEKEIAEWIQFVKGHSRPFLSCLITGLRPGATVRHMVYAQCNQSSQCALVDCGGRTNCRRNWEGLMGLYMRSVFCLMPPGDGCTRRATLDCMLGGGIPVVFEECAMQWPFHFPNRGPLQWSFDHPPEDPFYILIPATSLTAPKEWLTTLESQVFSGYGHVDIQRYLHGELFIEDVLKAIPESHIKTMQGTVLKMIPRFLYGGHAKNDGTICPPPFRDAFDITLDAILHRIKESRQGLAL